jgi:hypothetical protein
MAAPPSRGEGVPLALSLGLTRGLGLGALMASSEGEGEGDVHASLLLHRRSTSSPPRLEDVWGTSRGLGGMGALADPSFEDSLGFT